MDSLSLGSHCLHKWVKEYFRYCMQGGIQPVLPASLPPHPAAGVLRTAEALQHVYRQRLTSAQANVHSTLMCCVRLFGQMFASWACWRHLSVLFPIPAEMGSAWEQCPWLPTSPSPGGGAAVVGSAGSRAARGGRPRCSLLALMLARGEGDGCLVGRALLQHPPAPGKTRGWGFGKHCVVSS